MRRLEHSSGLGWFATLFVVGTLALSLLVLRGVRQMLEQMRTDLLRQVRGEAR